MSAFRARRVGLFKMTDRLWWDYVKGRTTEDTARRLFAIPPDCGVEVWKTPTSVMVYVFDHWSLPETPEAADAPELDPNHFVDIMHTMASPILVLAQGE